MTHPYQEPARSVAERVEDLLSRMTFEEKTAQMHALWLILSEDGRHRPRLDASGRLTVSVPKNVGAVPYYYNHEMKSAGTPVALHFGSRYPFMHGLSYTQFEFAVGVKCD